MQKLAIRLLAVTYIKVDIRILQGVVCQLSHKEAD